MTYPGNQRWLGTKLGTLAGFTLVILLISLSVAFAAQVTKQFLDTKPLVIKVVDVDFGVRSVSETFEVEYELENTSAKPVRILGCRVACSCTMPQALPFTIQPKEKKPFRVKVVLPETPQELKLDFRLFTNIKSQKYVDLGIHGNVKTKM